MNVVSVDVCCISLYGCYRVLGDISFLLSLWLVCYTQWFHANSIVRVESVT